MSGRVRRGQLIRYDAMSGVHVQVHLHRKTVAFGCHPRKMAENGPFGPNTAGRGCTVDLAHGGGQPARLRTAAWQKSSYSNPSGNCVEMALLPTGRVAVRDSRCPGGPVLTFTLGQWRTFLRDLGEAAPS